ncbi:MAG: AbiV family abortive infection protein [Flavobacteriales bacterium]
MSDFTYFMQGFRHSIINARNQFEHALQIAESEHYGLASSILVISAEESMKAYAILSRALFPFIEFENYNKVFRDHKFKIESIRGLVAMDALFQAAMIHIQEPKIKALETDSSNMSAIRKQGIDNMVKWLDDDIQGRSDFDTELIWWKKAQSLKERGFYVSDKSATWVTPDSVTKAEFDQTKEYVSRILKRTERFERINFASEDFKEFGKSVSKFFKQRKESRKKQT